MLDDPVRDALPDRPDDPRVVDLESDGQLGMTIPARIIGLFGGETYVVQRFRYRLDGRMLDADTIVGTVQWSSEQEIRAATDALLLSPYAQWTDPDPTKHRFVMRRIDGTWDCASLRDRVAGLLRILDSAVAGT